MLLPKNDWSGVLASEFEKPYFQSLDKKIDLFYKAHVVLPPMESIFAAFENTSFENTKVIIIGQDPYHGAGQANGLCFSVNKNTKLPPSLKNIYKEMLSDLGLNPSENGDLTKWAKQGVLLLNSTLTVAENKAGSHQKLGWETFTDYVIESLNLKKDHCVFILWGKFAQEKARFIDLNKHLILKSAHPSPLSAHNGFWGNSHFSNTNAFLVEKGLHPIDWEIE